MTSQPDDSAAYRPSQAALSGASPFNHPVIRDWFFETAEVPGDLMTPATTGSGPFAESEFDDFLRSHGVEPQQIGSNTDLLVIGRECWDSYVLDVLLKSRQGKRLRIYSQEMYLLYWETHDDPLEAPEDVVEAFRQGHPALEYISEGWSGWVSTFVPEEGSGNLAPEWPQIGLLKHMGYRVGSNGRPATQRRTILRRVFEEETLPNVESPEYMEGWGKAASGRRLWKMANSIAAFCRNNKRKRNPSEQSIAEWEEDLEWLRKEFYTGRFGFEWPTTYD